ncbi:2-hydroxycyclohexane-1-carbonyl-CoA dehydrogenase [Sphingobium jiangsuense]|uniref:NAD(P)-dependent dehydrogenase (Short-subunit alcohol dehydrogenase family) n=1 Tax=Sphingobium jiangsuense TaxID=870476 RepID=A0A7W6FQ43_9SPHN|nr:SDR family oxidoreductase [Sphingobium jiangsuense]MBB3926741.1 NAD(P)-dependent dehydrogenase (short-subunit alcohol dehydrogenase family) [Sphingobium jiangsuense]GLS99449.1 2-hydroxycyclohexane-1-carbonyl-CoA dehydrogenase [Sphingobium jiangsuense]
MYYPGLEGKNVLLIGGHSNLGQHVTFHFAESGANIVIGARDTRRAEEVAEKARSLGKGSVQVVAVDATDWASVENAVNTTRELGSVDVLYHGVAWDILCHFLDLDPALWDKIYEQNFKSVLTAYKIVLPIMIEQKDGCIITMSSVMGRKPTPIEPVYGALKSGLIHLAQTLALDVGQHNVRINVVAPGGTPPSDLSQVSANSCFRGFMDDMEQFRAVEKQLAAEVPLRRLAAPEEVSHAVLYLASPVTGGFQTGQVLGVDGGVWMPR